mmetsp:Transcript_60323/g.156697  ORF Transcript_60323/g.156697 Transcript_60323/m.156697 type:complete len:210 (+) Transcript_60323:1514-2143(+)
MLRLWPYAFHKPPRMRHHKDMVHPTAADEPGASDICSAEDCEQALCPEKPLQKRGDLVVVRIGQLVGVSMDCQHGAGCLPGWCPCPGHRLATRARRPVQRYVAEVQIHAEHSSNSRWRRSFWASARRSEQGGSGAAARHLLLEILHAGQQHGGPMACPLSWLAGRTGVQLATLGLGPSPLGLAATMTHPLWPEAGLPCRRTGWSSPKWA